MELLLLLKEEVPEYLWNQFKSSVQVRQKNSDILELLIVKASCPY